MKRADEEAHIWLDKMRHRDESEHRAEFDAWMAKPENAAAYARAGEEYEFHQGISTSRIAAEGRDQRSAPGSGRWAFATILAAAIALGYAWLVLGRNHETQIADLPAETPLTRLADGSLVVLTEGGRIETSFTADERRVILAAGRARFEVAHDSSRPFIVVADGSETVALGTIFEVDLLTPGQPRVALVEGSVEVRGSKSGRVLRLRPGEAAIVPEAGPRIVKPMTSAQPERVQADGTPLRAVLAQVNRTNAVPIRLADPALGDLEITGRFEYRDSAALARQLAAALALDVEATDAGPLLRARIKTSLPVKNP